MGKDSPDAPAPRDLAKEIQQILSQGPSLLASQRALSPGYSALDLSNLELALTGSPGGTKTVTDAGATTQGWRNSATGEFRTGKKPKVIKKDPRYGGSAAAGEWLPFTQQGEATTRDVVTPAQRGLLDIYSKDVLPTLTGAQNAANTATRTATYNDLRNLNPTEAGLYDDLAQSARLGLKAGTTLSPEETYRTVNPIRRDWSARGLGNSAPAQLGEALQLYEGGNNLLQQRQQMAASTANLGHQLYTLPALSFAPDVSGQGQNFLGAAGGIGNEANVFNSLGGYGSDLFNTNYNAQAASNINKSNTNNAAMTNYASLAALGLIAACWAAREVFGAQDDQWTHFRSWMLYRAPERFRNWYMLNGERWAERLSNNALAKAVVKRWMLGKIAMMETWKTEYKEAMNP